MSKKETIVKALMSGQDAKTIALRTGYRLVYIRHVASICGLPTGLDRKPMGKLNWERKDLLKSKIERGFHNAELLAAEFDVTTQTIYKYLRRWGRRMTEYNAANRRHIREAEKVAKLQETQRREIVGHILSTAPSRAWMFDLLASCHVFSPSFATDPYITAFREGERNVGLKLLAECNHHPDNYALMLKEAHVRDTTRELTRSPNPNGGDQEPGGDDDYGDEAA